jgi:hypothetical protein
MIEELLIGVIFLAAVAYVGRSIYNSYKGESGCSKGCGCDSPVHQFKKVNSKN